MLAGIIGPWQIAVVILAILLLFGGKKLPELARGLARGMRIFKDELHGVKRSLEDEPPADQAGQNKPQDQTPEKKA